MLTRSERGEGRVQSIIWLGVFALAIYAGFNVIPVYIANYNLADKVNQICRTPKSVRDEQILDMLWKEVQENRLDGYIQRSCFKVTTLDTSRRITCDYERAGKVLPGWNRTFHFKLSADQPLVF